MSDSTGIKQLSAFCVSIELSQAQYSPGWLRISRRLVYSGVKQAIIIVTVAVVISGIMSSES
ncbi:hypothetical protein QBC38DRAFT_450119 [Podospora fimiseda]|uniref:Uncharacterized protein n=1 Tax=Podospora fimiseda TaxID=252190 RepID=A0AAN7C0U7_9PEZI|nr:hypothetical protein QBC38DRAFT_450119 [Podospora fimiseda]